MESPKWFTASKGGECPGGVDMDYGCPTWYFSHVFWVGIMSTEDSKIVAKVRVNPGLVVRIFTRVL